VADLIFSRPPYSGGPVHLVFGGTAAPETAQVVGTVVLGGVSVTGLAQFPPQPAPAQVAGTLALGGVAIAGLAAYDNRNPRRATTAAALPHQTATATDTPTATGWHSATRHLPAHSTGWVLGKPAARQTAPAWQTAAHTASQRAASWTPGKPAARQTAAVHQAASARAAQTAAAWQATQRAQARAAQAAAVHQRAAAVLAQALAAWQTAAHLQRQTTARHATGTHRATRLLALWQVARPVPPGREVWPKPGQPTPGQRVPSTHLVFACPPWAGGPVALVFGRVCSQPTAPLQIAPARYYMAVHSLTAHHLPSMAPVPIYSAQLQADSGSFGWTFSAATPVSVFDQLAPTGSTPAQILITIDGLQFVFLVDKIQREESYGSRAARISGRSATALLARPYAREIAHHITTAATAQQLAAAALDYTGTGLDWGITDWLVPAGAWSHQGTPLSAVQAIAEAAGGYLQSHRSTNTIQVRHPYPELPGGIPGGPWNWSGSFAADVELSPSVITKTGIERIDNAALNAVYVSGTTQGLLARIMRAGTAADQLAPMVTDPLITAPEAALQRGLAILGAAGPKHSLQISLPILTGPAQPGILDVGQLVQINEATPYRARVRSVSVSSQDARQTVTLERHLGT
jgi:hypothetical protein